MLLQNCASLGSRKLTSGCQDLVSGVEAAGAFFEPIRINQYEGRLGQCREVLFHKVHLKIPKRCAASEPINSKSVLVTVVFGSLAVLRKTTVRFDFPVFLPARNKTASTWRMFITFDILDLKICRENSVNIHIKCPAKFNTSILILLQHHWMFAYMDATSKLYALSVAQ
jgi:hypothetical protein